MKLLKNFRIRFNSAFPRPPCTYCGNPVWANYSERPSHLRCFIEAVETKKK